MVNRETFRNEKSEDVVDKDSYGREIRPCRGFIFVKVNSTTRAVLRVGVGPLCIRPFEYSSSYSSFDYIKVCVFLEQGSLVSVSKTTYF